MCAKDRSHIAVRSQTDSIHSMREMLNISSCPAFIRDSRGEVIHTSPTFDKIFLTSGGTGAFPLIAWLIKSEALRNAKQIIVIIGHTF